MNNNLKTLFIVLTSIFFIACSDDEGGYELVQGAAGSGGSDGSGNHSGGSTNTGGSSGSQNDDTCYSSPEVIELASVACGNGHSGSLAISIRYDKADGQHYDGAAMVGAAGEGLRLDNPEQTCQRLGVAVVSYGQLELASHPTGLEVYRLSTDNLRTRFAQVYGRAPTIGGDWHAPSMTNLIHQEIDCVDSGDCSSSVLDVLNTHSLPEQCGLEVYYLRGLAK